MAEVTNVEKSEAPVKAVTLKLSVSEANDVRIFIEEFYKRKPYMPPASSNKVHQAITLGLKGKTSNAQKVEQQIADIFARPAYTSARF